MNVCLRQIVGSFMLTGGSASIFIGIAYTNIPLIAISPAIIILGTYLSLLPIPARHNVLPYYSSLAPEHVH